MYKNSALPLSPNTKIKFKILLKRNEMKRTEASYSSVVRLSICRAYCSILKYSKLLFLFFSNKSLGEHVGGLVDSVHTLDSRV